MLLIKKRKKKRKKTIVTCIEISLNTIIPQVTALTSIDFFSSGLLLSLAKISLNKTKKKTNK